MLNLILERLEKNNIEEYIVIENEKETVELYLKEEELEMGRKSKMKNYEIRLFKNYTEGEEIFKGSSKIVAYPNMVEGDIDGLILKGCNEVNLVKSEINTISEIVKEETIEKENKLFQLTLDEAAKKVKDTIYMVNELEEGIINSVEVFVSKTSKRIINSNGIDVDYEQYNTEGEFVTKWIKQKQREISHKFRFTDLSETDILAYVKEAIKDSSYINKETKDIEVLLENSEKLDEIVYS